MFSGNSVSVKYPEQVHLPSLDEVAPFMKQFTFFLIFIMAAASSRALAAESEPVGSVKTVQDKAFIFRNGASIPAATGVKIFNGDVLETNQTGSIGVIFKDDSLVSLGPDSRFKIDEYHFKPMESRYSFLCRLIRGTAAFVDGQIARLSPDSMRVQTPVAEIGVRGTRFAIQAEGNSSP